MLRMVSTYNLENRPIWGWFLKHYGAVRTDVHFSRDLLGLLGIVVAAFIRVSTNAFLSSFICILWRVALDTNARCC